MNDKKSWKEFQDTGLLLFINQFLHIFGWVIVYSFNENGEIINVYPARTSFRGFSVSRVQDEYKKITCYLKDNIDNLYNDFNFEKKCKDCKKIKK